MTFIKKIMILSTLLLLAACTHFTNHSLIANRDTAYLNARSIPPLQIPPGLSSSSIHEEYPIPDRNYPESAKRVSLIPPNL